MQTLYLFIWLLLPMALIFLGIFMMIEALNVIMFIGGICVIALALILMSIIYALYIY